MRQMAQQRAQNSNSVKDFKINQQRLNFDSKQVAYNKYMNAQMMQDNVEKLTLKERNLKIIEHFMTP